MHRSAEAIAASLLAQQLPTRWAHTRGVARRAEQLSPLLAGSADTLVQAALLHDVGYSPKLVVTGFHPLDGARHLARLDVVDWRVVRLVAHHSYARVEARLRALAADLDSEFPQLDEPLLTDALVFCDLTTTPDGRVTTVRERIAEILGRYGEESIVGRFIREAEPLIEGSVARIARLADRVGIVV